MGIIYLITSPSGKNYVGQTTRTLHKRLWAHTNKNSGCVILANAIKKYGWENMTVRVLQEASNEELNELERRYILEYNCLAPNGMNCNSGGGVDRVYSKEFSLKRSIAVREKSNKLGHIMTTKSGKFRAQLAIMGKQLQVGTFQTEELAQKAINDMFEKYDPTKNNGDLPDTMGKNRRKHSGSVYFEKNTGKYRAKILINRKPMNCGTHINLKEGLETLNMFIEEQKQRGLL